MNKQEYILGTEIDKDSLQSEAAQLLSQQRAIDAQVAQLFATRNGLQKRFDGVRSMLDSIERQERIDTERRAFEEARTAVIRQLVEGSESRVDADVNLDYVEQGEHADTWMLTIRHPVSSKTSLSVEARIVLPDSDLSQFALAALLGDKTQTTIGKTRELDPDGDPVVPLLNGKYEQEYPNNIFNSAYDYQREHGYEFRGDINLYEDENGNYQLPVLLEERLLSRQIEEPQPVKQEAAAPVAVEQQPGALRRFFQGLGQYVGIGA